MSSIFDVARLYDITYHTQFWINFILVLAALVLLLMRPKSKGIGFLIGFVIVQTLTTSGWYIRFFLGQAETFRSNQWFAFALNLALTILHTGGTVLFLAFILASWTKSNVAMGTPPRL